MVISPRIPLYSTWYDFKQELQRRSGLVVLNKRWLEIKPHSPLPWNELQMQQALQHLRQGIR